MGDFFGDNNLQVGGSYRLMLAPIFPRKAAEGVSGKNKSDQQALVDWWNKFSKALDKDTVFIFDPTVTKESLRDEIVSEGMPWGMKNARLRNNQKDFNRVVRGLQKMMQRGLPVWQGKIENGRFKVTNNTSALDADLQIVVELMQAAKLTKTGAWKKDPQFNYAAIAQSMLDVLFNTYIDTDGQVASLAPTPYDKGKPTGHLKSLSYVSMAELEAIRDFDTTTGHDWDRVIESEMRAREVVILEDYYYKSGAQSIVKPGQPYAGIPDWITILYKTRLEGWDLVSFPYPFVPEGRSCHFGYDAVRTLIQIAQDALKCKDSNLRARNVKLAKHLLGLIPKERKDQTVEKAIQAIRLHGYDGNPLSDIYLNAENFAFLHETIKSELLKEGYLKEEIIHEGKEEKKYVSLQFNGRAESFNPKSGLLKAFRGKVLSALQEAYETKAVRLQMLYSAYAALAYAAGDTAKFTALKKQISGRKTTNKYYEESLIGWSALLYSDSLKWDPLALFSGSTSKDIQKILQEDPYYFTAHFKYLPLIKHLPHKYFPQYSDFESSWGRNPSERARLDLIPFVFATSKERSAIKTLLATEDAPDSDIRMRTEVKTGNEMKALWLIDGAIEKYSYVLIYGDLGRHKAEISDAAAGLEGAIREGGIPALRAVRIYEKILSSRLTQNPFVKLGLAQAFLNTYKYENLALVRETTKKYLKSADLEISAKAAILYAEAAVREAQFLGANKDNLKDLAEAEKWGIEAEAVLRRAVTVIEPGIARLGEKYASLKGLDDEIFNNARIKEEYEKIGRLKAILCFQLANVVFNRAEIKSRDQIKREADYKQALRIYAEVLHERELWPELAADAIASIISVYECRIKSRYEDMGGILKNKKIADDFRNSPTHEIVDYSLALLQKEPFFPREIDKKTREGIRLAARIILEGRPHPGVLDKMDWFAMPETRKKVEEYIKLAQLNLRAIRLGLISVSSKEAINAFDRMKDDIRFMVKETPRVRVRSFIERILYFLSGNHRVRAKRDCESILKMAEIVKSNIYTPEKIQLWIPDPAITAKYRTFGYLGRTLQAWLLGQKENQASALRQLKQHLENLLGEAEGNRLIVELEKHRLSDNKNLEEHSKKVILDAINKELRGLKTKSSEDGKAVIDQALTALESKDYETVSELLERLYERTLSLKEYQKRLKKGETKTVVAEMELLSQVKKILEAIEKERTGEDGPVLIAKKLFTDALRKFRGQVAFTTEWYKKLVGGYLAVAWTIFNLKDQDGGADEENKKLAIAMMKDLLKEDRRRLFGRGSEYAQAFVEMINDVENRGFINVLLESDPVFKSKILMELGKMYAASGNNKIAVSYFRRALDLPEEHPQEVSDEANQYLAVRKDSQSAMIISEIVDAQGGMRKMELAKKLNIGARK